MRKRARAIFFQGTREKFRDFVRYVRRGDGTRGNSPRSHRVHKHITMKTKILSSFVLATTFLSIGANAQTPVATTSTPTPTTPAPVVVAPAASAPNQVIYSPRLPTVAELTSMANAQGLTLLRVEQASAQETAVYQFANGQTNVVSYQLLPASGLVGTTATPPPTIVETSPRVVYYEPAYDYYPGYYPAYWYPPVSLRLGFGYGYRGGYFRGGFRR